MHFLLKPTLAGFCITCLTAPCANAFIVNGDFNAGLTDWTPYTLTNSTIGNPTTTNFDTTGLGSNPAAQLIVGLLNFVFDTHGGGGLSQTFVGPAGDYTFSYDYASELVSNTTNASGGLFSLIFNGTVLSSFHVEYIQPNSVVRGSLNAYLAGVSAGTHEIKIQATRPFITSSSTPVQYFDNVVVNVPGPVPLLGAGAAFGFSRKLRQRIKHSTPLTSS